MSLEGSYSLLPAKSSDLAVDAPAKLNLVDQAVLEQNGGIPKDPYWDYVMFCFSTNPNATVVDNYNNKFPATTNSSIYFKENYYPLATQGSSNVIITQGPCFPLEQKNGYWSTQFYGANTYLFLPTGQASLALNTNDFTVEFFIYIDYVAAATPYIFTTSPTTTTAELAVAFTSSTNKLLVYVNGTDIVASATNGTFQRNKWVHIAVCRTSGNTYYVYIDGVLLDNIATNSTSITTNTWRLGNRSVAANYLTGHVSNFRILNGTALYTGASLTVPSEPLSPTETNTVALICNGFFYKDDGPNNYTVFNSTTAINPQVPFSPFDKNLPVNLYGFDAFPNLGALCTPTGQIWPYSADSVGDGHRTLAGDFTIEGWFSSNVSTNAVNTYLYTDSVNLTTATGFRIIFGLTSGFPSITLANASYTFNTVITSPTTGQGNNRNWMHLALVRQNGELTCYLNGRNVGTNNSLATVNNIVGGGSQFFGIGVSGTTYNNGFFAGIKVSNEAVYTSGFDPLDTYKNYATESTLLFGVENNGVYVDKARKAVSYSNSAFVLSNRQLLFGKPTLYFPSVAADRPMSVLFTQYNTHFQRLFRTGAKCTLELWYYLTNTSGSIDMALCDSLGLFFKNDVGTLQILAGGLSPGTQVGTFVTGQWSHFALVNTGSGIDFYRDGTRTYTGYGDIVVSSTTLDFLGTVGGSSVSWNSYLGPIRLTAGINRYTGSSYTVPTEDFPTAYGT